MCSHVWAGNCLDSQSSSLLRALDSLNGPCVPAQCIREIVWGLCYHRNHLCLPWYCHSWLIAFFFWGDSIFGRDWVFTVVTDPSVGGWEWVRVWIKYGFLSPTQWGVFREPARMFLSALPPAPSHSCPRGPLSFSVIFWSVLALVVPTPDSSFGKASFQVFHRISRGEAFSSWVFCCDVNFEDCNRWV